MKPATHFHAKGSLARRKLFDALGRYGRKLSAAVYYRPPQIEFWYGSRQVIGLAGRPQPDFNLLGQVRHFEQLRRLAYTLNGGPPQPVRLGPDGRRLARPGDFNLEIPLQDLHPGSNQVVLAGEDRRRRPVTAQVELDCRPQPARAAGPLQLQLDWQAVASLQTAVQVVDGRWQIDALGLRTNQVGYDRLCVLGDSSWRYIEVQVPVWVHRLLPAPAPSNGAGFGLILRWNGHSDVPVRTSPPRSGWLPQGAAAWYSCDPAGRNGHFRLEINGEAVAITEHPSLELEQPYMFKLRIEPGSGREPGSTPDCYRFKYWSLTQPEPAAWQLQGSHDPFTPHTGSLALVAHQADVTFGNLEGLIWNNA